MKFRLLFAAILLLPAYLFAQSAGEDDPVYVVDSVKVTAAAATGLTPDKIGLITIAKGRGAVLRYGSQAENGVVYIETKEFARRRVETFLRAVSPAYDSLRRQQPADSAITFLVNDKLVSGNDEARLFTVDRKTFVNLKVLSPEVLREKYQVEGKKAGVAIISSDD
jgi:hypothetical protein